MSNVIPLILLCLVLGSCRGNGQTDSNRNVSASVAANSNSNINAGETKQESSDRVLTARAKLALLGNKLTGAYDINASAQDGVVTLTGVMDIKEAAAGAADLVRFMKGVKGVNNQIQVDPLAKPIATAPEEQIDKEVKGVLKSDPGLQSLNVRSKGGEIMLTGSVDTHERLLEAATAIRKVNGVRFVYTKQVDVRNDP